MAGDDLDSSLIVPLIRRAEPEGAGGSCPLSWPERDTPIAEELAGELYVVYGFDLPGAFRLLSRRDCARMQLDAGDLRPLAVRNLTRRRARPQIKQAPAALCSCWTATWNPACRWWTTCGSRSTLGCPAN
jgi:hypothetical protein